MAAPSSSGASQPDLRAERLAALKSVRGRNLLAYVTTTRPGLHGSMDHEAIPVIYQHLREMGLSCDDKQPLDLFLHTYGGDSTVPWRLMSLLREFASHVALLVPHYAYSAGTLAALGADEVVMHPMGVLGPTDTTLTGPYNPQWPDRRYKPIEVEDVRSYVEWVREDVGVRHEDELVQALGFLAGPERIHPLALGGVKRSVQQSKLMGERLLGTRSGDSLDKHEIDELIESLSARLFYHGHPINRQEARKELFLKWVTDASQEEADAMWALYESYVDEMALHREWSPTKEALAEHGSIPELPTANDDREPCPTRVQVDLDPVQLVRVESEARRDCQQEEWTVTLSRNGDGSLDTSYIVRSLRWQQSA